jgi:hypothetical protein
MPVAMNWAIGTGSLSLLEWTFLQTFPGIAQEFITFPAKAGF